MTTIYVMSGLPFSGKSTLSRAISNQLKIPRISFDETWIEIENTKGRIPGKNNLEKWNYINHICEQKAKKYLELGISIVYDDLGSTVENRNKIRNLARESKAESKVVYAEVSREEVISRRERNLELKERSQVSDENFDNALEHFEPPTLDEKPLIYKPEQKIKDWIDQELNPISKGEKE